MPPKIPTSFVPHQQFVPQSSRPQRSGRNLFLIGSLAVLVVALVAAALTFAYSKYLQSVRDSKEATVAQEEQGIDPTTVEGFVALSDRLSAATTILKEHILTSQFFDLLEGITLKNVSIDSVKLVVADDRSATLSIAGTAASFNALAAESAAFASQTLIKHAIFSGLDEAKDGTVAFTVTANVDPQLLLANGTASASSSTPAAAASSTPAATLPPPPAPTGTTTAAQSLPSTPSTPPATSTKSAVAPTASPATQP